jgi:uncharacterized lipoprotein NlpE involved in copper resistance
MKKGFLITSLACLLTLSACNNEAEGEEEPEMHFLVTLTCYFGGEKIVHQGTAFKHTRFARVGAFGSVVYKTTDRYSDIEHHYSPGVPCSKEVEEVPVGSQE